MDVQKKDNSSERKKGGCVPKLGGGMHCTSRRAYPLPLGKREKKSITNSMLSSITFLLNPLLASLKKKKEKEKENNK